MTNRAKFLLKASFIGSFAEQMLAPIWAGFTEHLGGSLLDAGIGFAIFSIATGIIVLAVGRSKRFNENLKLIVLVGFLTAGTGDLLYYFVRNMPQLFMVQAFIGISVGFLNPAWDAVYSDEETEDEKSGHRWSFWTGGMSFVVGVSALVGALIVKYFGFPWLFPIMFLTNTSAVYFAWKAL